MNARVERVEKMGKNGPYEVLEVYIQANNEKWVLIQEIFLNQALKSVLDFIQE